MKDCKYLYNVEEAMWKDMPYSDALILKNMLAQRVIKSEIKKPLATRDMNRVNDVLKAIRHNNKLLEE